MYRVVLGADYGDDPEEYEKFLRDHTIDVPLHSVKETFKVPARKKHTHQIAVNRLPILYRRSFASTRFSSLICRYLSSISGNACSLGESSRRSARTRGAPIGAARREISQASS